MRRILIASALALAMLPGAAAAAPTAPMSTSPQLAPLPSITTPAWSKRVCVHWGYCGHGYHKYKCCKKYTYH